MLFDSWRTIHVSIWSRTAYSLSSRRNKGRSVVLPLSPLPRHMKTIFSAVDPVSEYPNAFCTYGINSLPSIRSRKCRKIGQTAARLAGSERPCYCVHVSIEQMKKEVSRRGLHVVTIYQ